MYTSTYIASGCLINVFTQDAQNQGSLEVTDWLVCPALIFS